VKRGNQEMAVAVVIWRCSDPHKPALIFVSCLSFDPESGWIFLSFPIAGLMLPVEHKMSGS
jgi:hypothetical protein